MRVPCVILLAVVLATVGCSAQPRPATVQIVPQQPGSSRYVQRFTDTYAVQRNDGRTDVVLTETTQDGLDQYLHLRLLWRPMRGTKTDQPSTTNAVIDWYVFSQTDPNQFLRYTGAGLVSADPKGNGMDVTVRNATLRLAGRRGNLVDPLGPSTLKGAFRARVDGGRVDQTLAELQAATARGQGAGPARVGTK
jgi:hypothetical protein